MVGGLLTPALALAATDKGPTTHTVYSGQTLGRIAKRYNVSIEAICAANRIPRKSPIKPGQKLFIPAPGTTVEEIEAANDKAAAQAAARSGKRVEPRGWKSYVRAPKRKGYVTLEATGRRWKGYALARGNRLSDQAPEGFRHTLYSWRTGNETDINPRLINLLIRVSDTFGGRTIHIASGYREHSFAKESKHKQGDACDFRIDGVPNEALRDYLLTLDGVGVGYYPNSSFVHLDVRPEKTTWIDTSGPGSAPRYIFAGKTSKRTVNRQHLGPRELSRRLSTSD